MLNVPRFTTKEELASFVFDGGFKILNLCHIPEDGRLKTLSFSVVDKTRVLEVLEFGERVDGSSLFSFIEPGKSDIYVMPRFERVFVNPFAVVPTLNVLCDYFDENGQPLDVAPRNVLARAENKLLKSSGVMLKALVELEYYVAAEQQGDLLFPGLTDRNYHESAPFAQFESLRNEILLALARVGIATKYSHSEVGKIAMKDGAVMEQHEVEFTLQSLSETADNVAIAKWAVRNLCARYGATVTFSPKISLEHAGSGMHIHLCGVKESKNIVADASGQLSQEARTMIGGVLRFASSLTAFANPTPVSYLRFVVRKESPMHVCWAMRNRLALIRVPLWWSFNTKVRESGLKETFEYRGPDAFADAYLLFAGLALATDYGFGNVEEALQTAERLHLEGSSEDNELEILPCCCSESADHLEKDRGFYEGEDVFPERLVDKTVEKLRAFGDRDLRKQVKADPSKVEKLMQQYLHYG